MLVLALGGCATTGSSAPPQPARPPAPIDATPVSPGLAQTLETAPAGARFSYRLTDSAEVALGLGPLYQSVRGVPCRLGRAEPTGYGAGRPDSYPFCRFGNQWYAAKAVVISGY